MNQTEREARKTLFGEYIKDRARGLRMCLAPLPNCKGGIVRAHSVQNSRVLEVLETKGHVIMPQLRTSFSAPPHFEFCEVGVNKATTFLGLCGRHDTEIFRPIEHNVFDPSNPEHLFLTAHRAILKETHSSLKLAGETRTMYDRMTAEGFVADDGTLPASLGDQKVSDAFYLHEAKECFDELYLTSNWDGLAHTVIDLETDPSLAVASLFLAKLSSSERGVPVYVALNILPIDGTTFLILSTLKGHGGDVRSEFSRVIEASGHYRLYILSKLVLERCDNLVIAPKSFRTFSSGQVEQITAYFERNIPGYQYELEDPRIFIFGPVGGE